MPSNFSIYKQNGRQNFPSAAKEVKVEITFKDENGSNIFGTNPDKKFGTIIGYLSKEFEYTATGNYTNIFDVKKGSSLLLNLLEDESQRNIANYGYLTKKMYTNGDSPTIDISFRCYGGDDNKTASYDNITHPISIANALINATLPRVGKNALLNFTNLSDTKAAQLGIDLIKTAGAGYSNLGALSPISIPGVPTLDEANENSNQAVNNLMSTSYELYNKIKSLKISDLVSKKPPVCFVKIGNIFEKDMMVVKTVSVKISKEFISEGLPLYADFDVSLQSLFNSATLNSEDTENEKVFGSGFNLKNSKNRVSFDA